MSQPLPKNQDELTAQEIFSFYSQALSQLATHVDGTFTQAVDLILQTTGRIIVIGIGKSGLVGQKIAATFASTGTSSFFVHAAEAIHGDLGMLRDNDLALMISYSGETGEIVNLLPSLDRLNVPVLAIVGKKHSTLGKHARVTLEAKAEKEVCPHNLAPTTSTLLTLAIGDALAVALMEKRGFTPKNFALYHPGGRLGRQLLTTVAECMVKDNLPFVSPKDTVTDGIWAMTKGRLGLCIVRDKNNKLVGLFTDGDLRRLLMTKTDLSSLYIQDVMNENPKTVNPSSLIAPVEDRMRSEKLNALIAINDDNQPLGVLQLFQT